MTSSRVTFIFTVRYNHLFPLRPDFSLTLTLSQRTSCIITHPEEEERFILDNKICLLVSDDRCKLLGKESNCFPSVILSKYSGYLLHHRHTYMSQLQQLGVLKRVSVDSETALQGREREWSWHPNYNRQSKHLFNPLKTNGTMFYLKTHSVPRSKHFSSGL